MHPGARQGGLSRARCPGRSVSHQAEYKSSFPDSRSVTGPWRFWNLECFESGIDLRIGRRFLPSRANRRIPRPSRTLKRLFPQGRFVVGAGSAVSLETSLAETQGVGLRLPGGKLIDSLRCFPAHHGLGVIWTRLEDHPPEPPGLGPVSLTTLPSVDTATAHSNCFNNAS